ncbi:MAG: rhodanese-like domain-containing protein [Verrucomicrobiaceae bacterium]|nr:rhodanese-like domain-containing protein [Verrucomicrobiaceae bacterium]
MIRQAAILILLSVVCASATHFFHPRAPAWYLVEEKLAEDEVSMAVIEQKWKGDVFWIDARISSQYEAGHVPGAVSLNEQNFNQSLFDQITTLQDLKKPLVIYCDSQKCDASRNVRKHLLESIPLENVFVLKGGWQAWQQSREQKPR